MTSLPPKVVPAESSILLERRIGVYVGRTLQNIVLRNTLGLALHPYCFSLRWCGIRLFYYTIFVANLEKFCLFSPPPEDSSSSFHSVFSRFLRLRFHFVYHHLTYPDSSEVRRFRSYDFYPVNNVDFNMMSPRLWTSVTYNLSIAKVFKNIAVIQEI